MIAGVGIIAAGKKFSVTYYSNSETTMAFNRYELTATRMTLPDGTVVRRIRALDDIVLADGSVVSKGSLGGWVQSMYNLDQTGHSWIFDNGKSYHRARVSGSAIIRNEAAAFQQAMLYGNAVLEHRAVAFGNCRILDTAVVRCDAQVFGFSIIYGAAKITGFSRVGGHARIAGNVIISGRAILGEIIRLREHFGRRLHRRIRTNLGPGRHARLRPG